MGKRTNPLLALRPFARRMGWDIIRYPAGLPPARRQRLLSGHGVDLVVDVGANVGQYGKELRAHGYAGRILSFEPMADAFTELAAVSQRDGSWEAVKSAVGTQSGEITINISGNSISSSALPMLERHARVAPASQYIGAEVAPIDRLDVLAGDVIRGSSHPFLKIDTQGYEGAVLDGAEMVLDELVGVEIEMSLTPLYEGQMLLVEAIQRMESHGFRLAGLSTGLTDMKSGETLQADGVFVR